jgi:hypothetical protein
MTCVTHHSVAGRAQINCQVEDINLHLAKTMRGMCKSLVAFLVVAASIDCVNSFSRIPMLPQFANKMSSELLSRNVQSSSRLESNVRRQVGRAPKGLSVCMQLRNPSDQAAAFATSAAIAVSAVNAAVSMRQLEAPEVDKTYIVQDSSRLGSVDESGLPIVYDKELIGFVDLYSQI